MIISWIEISEMLARPKKPAGWYAEISYVDGQNELTEPIELGPFASHWEACSVAAMQPEIKP